MIIGTVINQLCTKKSVPELEKSALLLVKSMETLIPAVDRVGATAGDRVLLATGHSAAAMDCPADAAVIAILDTAATE